MHQRQEPMTPDRQFSQADGFTLLYLLITGMACCLLPLCRSGFGMGAFYPGGLVALAIMFCYAGFSECPEDMGVFFCLWLPLVLLHRARTLLRAVRGDYEHSKYDGWPWLSMWLCRLPPRQELAAKGIADPLLLLLAGLVLGMIRPKLGLFVSAGGVAVFAKAAIEHLVEMSHDRAQRDAEMVLRARARRRRGGW